MSKFINGCGCATCVLCAVGTIGCGPVARCLRRALRFFEREHIGCCGNTAGEPNGRSGDKSRKSGIVGVQGKGRDSEALLEGQVVVARLGVEGEWGQRAVPAVWARLGCGDGAARHAVLEVAGERARRAVAEQRGALSWNGGLNRGLP